MEQNTKTSDMEYSNMDQNNPIQMFDQDHVNLTETEERIELKTQNVDHLLSQSPEQILPQIETVPVQEQSKSPHIDDYVKELKSKIAALELELQQKKSLPVNESGDVIHKEEHVSSQPHSHPPGSIMSLSTGSEESGGDEEKFVKIKPCEMESNSSKASSQSGKENLELEEQIHSLVAQCESLKQSLTLKEEECDKVKLELEARLLEKNVETGNITETRNELKAIREKLNEKEEEYNELILISGDLVKDLEKYIPSEDVDELEGEVVNLDLEYGSPLMNKIKLLPQAISLLKGNLASQQSYYSEAIQAKDNQILEVTEELRDLKEQQEDIVGGYQLISANYDKLQNDYEALLQSSSTEEIERFKTELIAKDEDLTEMELRVDAAERNLILKDEIILELENKLQGLSFSNIVKNKVDRVALTELLKVTEKVDQETLTELLKVAEKVDQDTLTEPLRVEKKVDQETLTEPLRVEEKVDQETLTEPLRVEDKVDQETLTEPLIVPAKVSQETLTEPIGVETKVDQETLSDAIAVATKVDQETLTEQIIDDKKVDRETLTDIVEKNQTETSSQTEETTSKTHLDPVRILPQDTIEEKPQTSSSGVSPEKLSVQCCNKLKVKLDHTQSRIQFLESNIEQLCATIAELDVKLNEKETELAEQGSTLDQSRLNCEKLSVKLKDFEQHLNEKTSEFEQAKQNIIDYERINSELAQKLSGLVEQNSILANNQAQHSQELNSAFVELQTEIQKKNSEMEQIKHNFHTSIQQKDVELSDLRERFQRSITSQEYLSSQLREKEVEVTEKTLTVAQLKEKLKEFEECVDRKFKEINETLEKKDSEVQKLLQTYSAYYQTKESAVAQLNNLLQNKETCIQSLNETLLSVNQELKESMNLVHEQKLDLSRKTHILNSLRNENVKLTTLLKESEMSFQELERQLQEEQVIRESEQLSNQQQIIGLAQQQVNLTNQLREGDIKSVELKQDLEGIEHKTKELMEAMDKRNIELQDCLSEKEVIIFQLESECSRLREAYSELELKYATEIVNPPVQILPFEIQSKEVKVEELQLVSNNDSSSFTETDSLEVDATLKGKIVELENKIFNYETERKLLEQKIELLQSKIFEIEESEINSFEERFMLKEWCRELELQNMKYQDEINAYGKGASGSSGDKKVDTLHTEIMRLISCLEERDKRCEQLTMEITRLLEERDELQLKLSNVLRHNVELNERMSIDQKVEVPIYDREDLRAKLSQLEESNFRMKIDLRREKEARRLVQEQLLFSHSSRLYRDLNSRTGTGGPLDSRPISSPQTHQHSPKAHNSAITSQESASTSDSGHVSPTTV